MSLTIGHAWCGQRRGLGDNESSASQFDGEVDRGIRATTIQFIDDLFDVFADVLWWRSWLTKL